MMLDGRGKIREALTEFAYVKDHAPSDSYYIMDASYEVARLSLALWLSAPTSENTAYLDTATNQFRFWLARDWNKLTSKLWGYYHGICAYRQKIKIIKQNNGAAELQEDESLLKDYINNFLSIARAQKGVRKYDLRFSAFFLASNKYERFPGEPLRCELNDLLSEFQIF